MFNKISRIYWKYLRIKKRINLELKKFINILDLIQIIKACGLAILLLLLGVILFIFVDQVRDLIRQLYYFDLGNIGRIIFFNLSVLAWALSTWYIARTSLYINKIELSVYKKGTFIDCFQKWFPRILGGFTFLVIIFVYTFVFFTSSTKNYNFLIFSIGITLILALIYLFFVIFRRKFFKSALEFQLERIKINRKNLPEFISLYILFIMLIAVILITIINYRLIIFPGSAAIIISGLILWISTFHLLFYYSKKNKIPWLIIIICISVIFSFFNNNHSVRLLKDKNIKYKRDTFSEYYNKWMNSKNIVINKERENDNKFPVIMIAIDGGGLRSACWSSLLLSAIEEKTGNKFHNHIFCLSGISGGSVGASIYAGLIRDYYNLNSAGNFNKKETFFIDNAQEILDNDFLSPLIAAFFYSEFLQKIIPVAIKRFDRTRYLELAWEDAWKKNYKINNYFKSGYNTYSDSFLGLLYRDNKYKDKYAIPVPALFFNTTRLENGSRVILSNICLDFDNSETETNNDYFEDLFANENIQKYSARIRLSTAALLSSRFPYVTPPGRIHKDPDKIFKNCYSNLHSHLGDGGYFENSGCATLYDIFNNFMKQDNIDDYQSYINNIELYLVILRNDEIKKDNKNVKIGKGIKQNIIHEITQPAIIFGNSWDSRSPYSRKVIKDQFIEKTVLPDKETDRAKDNYMEINMNKSGNEVPLGWYLSEESLDNVVNYINDLFKNENDSLDSKNVKRLVNRINNYYK